MLPRSIYVLSNGTDNETCARYTGRRRICHSRIGARSRLGGHSSRDARETEARGERVLKRPLICNNNGRSISDTGDDFPPSIAYSSRVTHPRSCGDYEAWIAVIVIGAENSTRSQQDRIGGVRVDKVEIVNVHFFFYCENRRVIFIRDLQNFKYSHSVPR